MNLSERDKTRYNRHLLLNEVGLCGQQKIKSSKVLVIGAGGLGCPSLLYLAAAGVGTIGIIDFDKVEESNLQRQVLFETKDIGKNKATCAKQKLDSLNPLINIIAYNFALSNKNALDLFTQFDIIVDGTDNFTSRYIINDACFLSKRPLIYGSIHKFEGQVSVFHFKNGPSYRCLFPTPPSPESTPSCSQAGVLGVLPGVIGSMQCNEALKIILGIGDVLSGRLSIYDSLNASMTEFIIPKSNSSFQLSAEEFKTFDYKTYCTQTKNKINAISLKKFNSLSKDAIILDVREQWESPVLNAERLIHIPLALLHVNISKIPKKKIVYVVCQKGIRSQKAITELQKLGYKNLINVEGGLLGNRS